AFIWQDLSNVVRVQSVDGTVIKQFQNFATYGQVIDHSLTHYLSADDHWNIYSGAGEHQAPVLNDGISPSFVGTGKLLNLTMARDRLVFVTAGSNSDEAPITDYAPIDPDRRFSRYSGVTLWNLDTLKPIAKLPGNSAKTDATISPDGQWVVSGDENGNLLFWNTDHPNTRFVGSHDGLGIPKPGLPDGLPESEYWDDSGVIPTPENLTLPIISVAFIDHSRYFLRFGNNSHQAALFKAGNPWPQKYFDLGESPQLVTYGSQYSRNTAIATSPQAGVLVMGHRSGGGISVYRFDADTLTLERTWVVR
ncbi:MAG: WD40 repeat domain-containing protein, partial [Marinobacter sp.]|nr:WD40 repeat domain-containing protein [Marinobacter sp.]